MIIVHLLIAAAVIYLMLFVTYWKWIFIRKFLMTKEQVEDQDRFLRWIFNKACWLFGIKTRT